MVLQATQRFGQDVWRKLALRAFEVEFVEADGLVGSSPYFPPPSLGYARLLAELEDAASRERAIAILEKILASQELRPDHPDFGHFRMQILDPGIEDLNAVQLVLIELIPIAWLLRDRFPAEFAERLDQAIAAGVVALEEIGAHLTYTNVAVLDIANRILGGELLGDAGVVARGIVKLDDFLAYTNRHGGMRDYNSPTYLGQMISTMATLANLTRLPSAQNKAELIQERLWLQALTHYHPGLAQFAGPYSRAYPPDVLGASGQMKSLMFNYIGDDRLLGFDPDVPMAEYTDLMSGVVPERERPNQSPVDRMSGFSAYHLATRDYFVPAYLLQLVDAAPLPCIVRESAERDRGLSIVSQMGAGYALGSASRGFGSQARNLIAHIQPRQSAAPKVIFTRMLAQGDFVDLNSFDDRLPEWGPFAGLQDVDRVIGLYGVHPLYRSLEWIGVEIYLLGLEEDDVIWSSSGSLADGDRQPGQQWIFLDLGSVYVGLYIFEPTVLGAIATEPVEIHRTGSEARISIANYDGRPRRFWKYAEIPWEHPEDEVGPFYNGNLHAGVYLELADAGAWSSFDTFRTALETTEFTDEACDRVRTVSAKRDGRSLELGVDLMTFLPITRLVNNAQPVDPMLDAPLTAQLDTGTVQLGEFSIRSEIPGPWVVLGKHALSLTNPTAAPAVVHIDDTEIVLEPYGRAEVDRRQTVMDNARRAGAIA